MGSKRSERAEATMMLEAEALSSIRVDSGSRSALASLAPRPKGARGPPPTNQAEAGPTPTTLTRLHGRIRLCERFPEGGIGLMPTPPDAVALQVSGSTARGSTYITLSNIHTASAYRTSQPVTMFSSTTMYSSSNSIPLIFGESYW